MCLLKAGQYKEALAVMERMSGTGIKPDITMVRYIFLLLCILASFECCAVLHYYCWWAYVASTVRALWASNFSPLLFFLTLSSLYSSANVFFVKVNAAIKACSLAGAMDEAEGLARYVILCCAVLCCAVLCCAVLCCAVLCCAVLCCAVLCCAVLCCAVLCYSPISVAPSTSITRIWT